MDLLAIRQALTNGGPQAAERQLAILGNNHGDDQLALLVRELRPAEVTQLLAEGDYTKPSVVAHFITAEQFVGALHRLGAKWGSLKGVEISVLIPIKEQVSDFMLSTLLHGDDAGQKKFLEAVLDDSIVEDVLVMMPLYEPGCPEFLAERDWATAQVGTWQELYMRIRDLVPTSFDSLRSEVLSLFSEAASVDDDEEREGMSNKRADKFLTRALQSLANRSSELSDAKPIEKKDEIFEDL